MASVKSASRQIDVPDGSRLEDPAEELGAPFGCRHGVCGACVTAVLEGMENLCEPTDQETTFGLQAGERMMCQCVIRSGTVVLDLE